MLMGQPRTKEVAESSAAAGDMKLASFGACRRRKAGRKTRRHLDLSSECVQPFVCAWKLFQIQS